MLDKARVFRWTFSACVHHFGSFSFKKCRTLAIVVFNLFLLPSEIENFNIRVILCLLNCPVNYESLLDCFHCSVLTQFSSFPYLRCFSGLVSLRSPSKFNMCRTSANVLNTS